MLTSISESWLAISIVVAVINGFIESSYSSNKFHKQLLFTISFMSMTISMVLAGSINIKYFGFINSMIIILCSSVLMSCLTIQVRKELSDPPKCVKETTKENE